MRKVFLIIFLIPLFYFSNLHAGSNVNNNVPGSVFIEDNVDLTITGAGLGGDKIDFVLKYYPNPNDPDNLYWKLDIDSLKLTDEIQILRSGSYSFSRFPFSDGTVKQSFFGDYDIYDKYIDITVHNRENWSEAFARWIFGKIVIENKTYELVKTFEESSPSRIVAEYLGIIINKSGWELHKFRLHFPDNVDATHTINLYPSMYDQIPGMWIPECLSF